MNRRFSSNSSINLIQLDSDLEISNLIKSNSLFEMFDPMFDKHFPNNISEMENSFEKSTSSEDIFASPVKYKHENGNKNNLSNDELFQDFNESETYDSIYPNLSSFKSSLSGERYSVFDRESINSESVTSYDLRPSLFKELKVNSDSKNLFNDSYANKDMERFMKTVTELYMQSLQLATNVSAHLIFDLTSSINYKANENQSKTIRIIIEFSDSIRSSIEPYSSDVDVFEISERDLTSQLCDLLVPNIDISNLYFRLSGRGEYLKQADYPLIQNKSIFLCYRQQITLKLVLERIDLTEIKYQQEENIFTDFYTSIYQLFDNDYYNINKNQIDNGFLTLSSYRNSIASLCSEYCLQFLDLPSIEASMDVFKDKCKSLCLLCNNIYTTDVAQQILILEDMMTKMNIAYCSKNEDNLVRTIESLIRGLDQTMKVIIQMINEVTIFCNSNFSVRTEKLCFAGLLGSQSGVQSISKCRKQFSVKLESICCFKDSAKYNSFYLKISLKVGRQPLSQFLNLKLPCFVDTKISSEKYVLSNHPKFPDCICIDETFLFENFNMIHLPLEASLFIEFYGHRLSLSDTQNTVVEYIGWTEIVLFDSAGMLQQGKFLLGIWPSSVRNKCMGGINRLKSASILKIELPDFHVPVKYSNNYCSRNTSISVIKELKSESDLIENMVKMMWLKDNFETAKNCCDILWRYRGSLMSNSKHFIAFCLALVTTCPDGVENNEKEDLLLNYLERCYLNFYDISITELIHLLGPHMPLIKIRRWAVQVFREVGPDSCISLIPWLVEAIKYESNINASGLENLLLYFSVININFSTILFWQLSSVNSKEIHGYKAMLLIGMLRSLVNDAVLEMWNLQLTIVEKLQKTATTVKTIKNPPDRRNTLNNRLEELYDLMEIKNNYAFHEKNSLHPLCSYRIPYQPGLVLKKIEIKDCSYFNSCTLPLKIIFHGLDISRIEVMFKSGDDLRQDILVLQLFKLMDDIWISEGLDLRMVHYKVMSTGDRCGLIELVGDCTTLRKIQESKGIAAPLTNVDGISEWLQCQNPTKASYLESVNNFLLTCAASCVSTYLLGVGDRHNDNIMIQTSGCLFHIDFAKILGDAQTFAGIKRDRVPFVLTQDMVYVLNDYQPKADDRRNGMQLLIDKCCEAYNIIRRHWSTLFAILTMASEANIPGVNSKSIQYVVKMLKLECSDIQASEQFTDLIRKSVNSKFAPMNFFIHNLAQMKYSNNIEGSLFSFTPKIHKNGARILKVSLTNVKRIRVPSKYYTYQISVYKENSNNPEIVFRRFEHFVELAQQLATLFPLSILPKLYQHIIQCGPPNNIVTAESKRNLLQQYSSNILNLEDEISQCDLIHTFFYSTLSDEQFKEEDLFIPRGNETTKLGYPEIQLKFHVSNKGTKLEIFVKHARNLNACRFSEPPNPYVKTYILPGFLEKRKTKVIVKSSSPSFNDIITYSNIDIKPSTKVEVSVWHNELLGENFCMGSIVLPISKNMSNEEKWYQLNTPNYESLNSSLGLSVDRTSVNNYLNQSFPSDCNRYSKEMKLV